MKSNCNPLNLGIVLFLGCVFSTHASNVFVSDASSGTILQLGSGGTESVFASGLNNPAGLAFDGSGNLYVADSGNGTILRFNSSGSESVFATGLNDPAGLAFGNNGNLYVASQGDGTIWQFNSSGQGSVFASGLSNPTYLALGNNGSLYASTPNTIEEFNSNGGQTTIFSPLNFVYGIAADNNGDLYASLQNAGSITRVLGSGGPDITAASFPYELNRYEVDPYDLAFDASGNLFASFTELGFYGANGSPATLNGVIMEFDSNGNGRILASGLANPQYIAVQNPLAVLPVQFVPEPATWAMLLLGLGSFLVVRRTRCWSGS